MDMGKPLAVYKVIRYQKTPDDDPTVRFLQNGTKTRALYILFRLRFLPQSVTRW